MGPCNVMAPAGWEDAATNRKSVLSFLTTWERRRTGRRLQGRTPASHSRHRISGKKMNKIKFSVALGGRQSSTARNNQPNERRIDGREMRKDVRPSGNAGGALFDRYQSPQVGSGIKIYQIDAFNTLIIFLASLRI
jgi:hypothetical protein